MSGINGVLAGLLIAIAALWAYYLVNRLWQQSLAEEVADALAAAEALGLARAPAGLWPAQVVSGALGGASVRVEWRGGPWGAHSVVEIGQTRRTWPLIRDADALREALGPLRPAA